MFDQSPPAAAHGRYPFAEPVTHRPAALIVNEAGIGIEHDATARDIVGRCTSLADVTLELDAWSCRVCGTSGRVSGAWVVRLLEGTHADRFGRSEVPVEPTVPVAAFRELFDFAVGADEALDQERGVGPYAEPAELARARAVLAVIDGPPPEPPVGMWDGDRLHFAHGTTGPMQMLADGSAYVTRVRVDPSALCGAPTAGMRLPTHLNGHAGMPLAHPWCRPCIEELFDAAGIEQVRAAGFELRG